ncbi:MAG: hypothetical protein AAFV49_24095, partial [Pseudomonadota bacterium]
LSFLELYAGQPLAHEAIAWLAERGFRLLSVHMEAGQRDRAGRAVQADFLFARAPGHPAWAGAPGPAARGGAPAQAA